MAITSACRVSKTIASRQAALRGQDLACRAYAEHRRSASLCVERFCGGLRFLMGLAVNKAGDLFASDNQGHYNPFNEINQLTASGTASSTRSKRSGLRRR
jgi:hypothetical protein